MMLSSQYELQLGSYILPKTFAVVSDEYAVKAGIYEHPQNDGACASFPYLSSRRMKLAGTVHSGTFCSTVNRSESVREPLDVVLSRLRAAPTTFKMYPDREWRGVYAETQKSAYENQSAARFATVEFDIVMPDPYQYLVATSSSPTNSISASPTTVTISAGGLFKTPAKFSVTIGGSGAQTIAISVSNTTTGQAFTLTGAVTGGDVIDVDAYNHTVKIGTVNKISLFDGVFVDLNNSANSVVVAYNTGTITNLAATWNERYL